MEYDRRFHIPVQVRADPLDTRSDERARNHGTDHRLADRYDEDEGYKSDYRRRWEPEQPETEAEERDRIKRQGRRRLDKLVKDMKIDSEKAKEDEEKELKELEEKWEDVKSRRVEYEALSWTWGKADEKFALLIKAGSETFKMRVRRELALALKYLRRPGQERYLWIDAVCINQADLGERNHQVQMMSRIYTRAKQGVCLAGRSRQR